MINILKKIALAGFLGGIVFYIIQTWDFSVIRHLTPDWKLIVFSCLILFLHFMLVSALSYWILTPLHSLPFGKYMGVYFITQMGRYVPGKIWLVVGKIEFLKKEGFSKTWIASTSFLEIFLMLVGAGIISLFGTLLERPAAFENADWILFLFTGLSIVFILAIKPLWQIIQRLIDRITGASFAREGKPPYSALFMVLITMGYSLSWIIQGLGFTLLIKAFFPDYNHLYFFVITYAFSWIAGFLAIFAPSGIGVKESVIILLLNQVMLPTESIVMAVVQRIWTSGIEIIIAVVLSIKMLRSRK